MKKSLTIIIAAALAAALAMGCENAPAPSKSQAPASAPATSPAMAPATAPAMAPAAAPSQEVRAVATSGESLTGAFDQVDQQLDRLEQEAKSMSRKAQLDESKVFNFDTTGAAVKGPDTAKLTMLVFSDFQCPFCARFAAASKQLLEKYPNDLRLIFMNFPLDEKCNPAINRPFHQRACLGAQAGMAALAQGKFWEMHDWLFANQNNFSAESIEAAAPTLGLNAAKIKDAIDNNKYTAQIQAQARQMLNTPGRGTPTVFINGMIVQNANWSDINSVSDFINGLLHPEKEAEQTPKAAVVVQNASSLPTAKVVLDDGTLLEDRLNVLEERLAKISLRPGTPAPPKPKNPDPNKVYSFDLSKSPAVGASTAPVTVVVFSDLVSPQAQLVATELKEIQTQFPDKVRWVFKALPGRSSQSSVEALEAAMAANAQGKFWPMHDLILQNRGTINGENLRKFAQQLGLDMAKYDDDAQKHPYRPALIADMKEADLASVSMAPAVFVNGKYQPDVRKEALVAAVQGALGQGGTK